jgi:hypothetical protein
MGRDDTLQLLEFRTTLIFGSDAEGSLAGTVVKKR